MAVVIRLQGLRITAGSEDIRNFFTGLRIPDGGVHIIGGELEEAFIIFASDEDARRAMARSGGCIKGSPVNLLLSSKSEMQSVLEESTRRPELKNRGTYKEVVKSPSAERGPLAFNKDPRVDKRRPEHQEMRNRPPPSSFSETRHQREGSVSERDELYLKLIGMPYSATKDNVYTFFSGLQIDDIMFLRNPRGQFNGHSIVRFASKMDAVEGLKKDRQYMGPRYIQLTRCSEEQWLAEGGIVKTDSQKRASSERARSRSPISYKSRSRSPSHEEYCVMFENLPYMVEKRDLRVLLHPVSLKDAQIIIFAQKKDDRTKSAVVVFRNLTDYCAGLAHDKEMLMNKVVYVSPISKEKMVTLLESSVDTRDEGKGSRRSAEAPQPQRNNPDSQLRCLYVRNLPFDVRKVEIMDFFNGFPLSEDRVVLLRDERGAGLGEALVIFQSEKEAMTAQSLNGQRFLGSEVMLKCITMGQMQKFGVNDQLMDSPQERNLQRTEIYKDAPHFSNTQMPQDDYGMEPNLRLGYEGRDRFEPNFGHIDAFGPGPDGNGHQRYGSPDQQLDGPICLKLVNLPSQIRVDEIYDFFYGYRVIPGSASLLYDRNGAPRRSATVAFETHREALTALQELNGRPIGTRKIQILFV
ncbi:RNA-binding protein 12B-like [Carassius gibelio]|uniref:RNA-binding protein 12B-like n=1 Tax=Carassius gibelio TaxID=101364 RepID=UPI0022794C12|nr:RNA-binding protein 12B-like [Carassius gibelio]XP_052429199.1 RNA-binding protein 12B-like [Carassius gibelio]